MHAHQLRTTNKLWSCFRCEQNAHCRAMDSIIHYERFRVNAKKKKNCSSISENVHALIATILTDGFVGHVIWCWKLFHLKKIPYNTNCFSFSRCQWNSPQAHVKCELYGRQAISSFASFEKPNQTNQNNGHCLSYSCWKEKKGWKSDLAITTLMK